MSKKVEKSYTEIISGAAKEIKEKAKKDVKKAKKVLNEPLFPKGKEKVSKKKNKASEAKNETKEETKKKNKALRVILIVSLSIILVGVLAYLLLNYLISDKTSNSFVDKGDKNQEIIQKEFVNGLSDMNNNFTFSLNEDDINQMLSNSLKKEEVSSYVKSAYLETSDSNFMWCFDLKVPVFTTRVVITSHLEGKSFKIDSTKIGKLNAMSYLMENNYLTDEMITTLFSNASLPIEGNLKGGEFIYRPEKFPELFDLGEATGEFFQRVNKPEKFEVLTNKIGFRLDISSEIKNPPSSSISYGLIDELEATLLENPVNSLTKFEETTLFTVSEEDFSKWISSWRTPNQVLEEIKSNLSNKKVQAKLVNQRVDFSNNHFTLKWLIKLGNIYFETSEDLGIDLEQYTDEFKNVFERPSKSESSLQKLLMDDFIIVGTSKGYLISEQENDSLTFDFESVFDNTSLLSFSSKTWRYVILSNNSFEFVVERIL